MEYILIGVLVLLSIVYLSCAYIIFKVVEAKNPGIYEGLSRPKKFGMMLAMPLLVIAMAVIVYFTKTPPRNGKVM